MSVAEETPIRRVLIANRGEIAVRIIRASRQLGIETVLAASQADRDSLPARLADRTICIGPARASESYLNQHLVITAALATKADAIHPGYGFLAESSELAQACIDNGIRFVGPPPDQIRRMGNKLQARIIAKACGVPILAGSEKIECSEHALGLAKRVGFPVLFKAAAGGGGRGMKIVNEPADLETAFQSAAREARAAFGDDTLYLERYIRNARHIEVQVLGDRFGNVVHLGERDCSLQRRHQKLLEEATAPAVSGALRTRIRESAVVLAQTMGYENAGTVEFIVDRDNEEFNFLEMNTRIQVEHPVTEMVTGIDLVQEQFRVARNERLRFTQDDVTFRGHAIECRINAELPEQGFRPNPGRIVQWVPPEGPNIRVDTHCYAGYTVPPDYDSLLAKLVVYGFDRDEAIVRMRRALEQFVVRGIGTTISFMTKLLDHPDFRSGRMTTHLVGTMLPAAAA